MGRGRGDHRGCERLYREAVWARSHYRFLAHPRDVHGLLRRREPIPVADRWRLHELLRLVLRPAAGLPADLGRADRRARERGLVQLDLPAALGLERAADADARCSLLYGGSL